MWGELLKSLFPIAKLVRIKVCSLGHPVANLKTENISYHSRFGRYIKHIAPFI